MDRSFDVSPEKTEAGFREKFARYRQDLIRQLLSRNFVNSKTRISSDGQKMMTEMVRLFVLEACARSAEQACDAEGLIQVTPEHLKKIIPQLLFDFL